MDRESRVNVSHQSAKDKHRSGRVRLIDVAHDAGVSRATASLVIRNSSLVSEQTREKVLKSIEKLGYVYNRGAAGLRTRQSYAIGLVVTDISNPYFAELAIGAEAHLEQSGYVALLANTSDTAEKQARSLETVLEHGVDGVLLCPADQTPPDEVARLHRLVPLVSIARSLSGVDIDYIGPDNVCGTQLGVEHLIAHGHQRIAFVGGPLQSSAREERLKGYKAALKKNGLDFDKSLLVTSQVSRNGGYSAILSLLESSNSPTAAMCYNDIVAFGVMLGLQAAGYTPGKDFAVVGFDNIADAATWPPPLTTVSGDPHKIGEVAASRLLERIQQPTLTTKQSRLPCNLIVRESCGAHT
jgi:LacI family transcriptional regulator